MPQQLIYICQDGHLPSGVASYGYHFLRRFENARMILLNATTPPVSAPEAVRGRMMYVAEEESHNPLALKNLLTKLASQTADELVIFPNTGDTPWVAVAGFLREATAQVRARVRLLAILHSDMESQYTLAEQYLPIAPVWVGVSGKCAEVVQQRVGGRGAAVHRLFVPVDVPSTVAERPEAGPLRIAFVGRLDEPQKRVSRLPEVFNELLKLGGEFSATLAGDGPAALELRATIEAQPQLKQRVKLPGSISRVQIDALWPQHDVFILVSAYEGLPLALLEAMAAQCCPVVMQVASGLPELLVDGQNARVVPQGDSVAMAQVLKQLMDDRTQLKRIAAQARRDIQERFSVDKLFAEFTDIIKTLWSYPPPNPEALQCDPSEQAVVRLVQKLKAAHRPVVVYGAGMFGRKVVDGALEAGLTVAALVDSNPAREGTLYRGIACTTPAHLKDFPQTVIALGTLQFSDDMIKKITEVYVGASVPTIYSEKL